MQAFEKAVGKLHQVCDKLIAAAIKQNNQHPPCRSGCFWCCKEPAYVTRSEVRYMLQTFPPEELGALKAKVMQWATVFFASDLPQQKEPPVFQYRKFNLWCPFLKDGKCSAYERRPYSCRAHIAKESSAGCEHDSLRSRQKFMMIVQMPEIMANYWLQSLETTPNDCYDHLGVLLYEELTGLARPTVARVAFEAEGEHVTVYRYGD